MKFLLWLVLMGMIYQEPETILLEAPQTSSSSIIIDSGYELDTYVVTAYTAGFESTGKNPDDPDYGITASGEYAEEGRTIACPPELDFGTIIEIESVGERICQDRGGAIKGKRIDLYMEDLHMANEFGKRELKVRIYKD